MGSSRSQYPGSYDPRIPDLGLRTPRCRRTSGRLHPPRRHWLCIGHRRNSERPLDTPCRKEDRTDTRVLPSLSHVMQSAASGHLTEFPGYPISPPLPLSTSTSTRAHWDRNRARPAVGEGFPLLLFRLQDGFTVPPGLTFPEAPL